MRLNQAIEPPSLSSHELNEDVISVTEAKPPSYVKNKVKWLQGRNFLENGFDLEQLNYVAYCLSYYYFFGDPSRNISAIKDPRARAALIKKDLQEYCSDKIPEGLKDAVWKDIDKKCQWKPKSKNIVKDRQQAGNIRAAHKARQKVLAACVDFIQRKNALPSISRLERLAKCKFSIAKEIVQGVSSWIESQMTIMSLEPSEIIPEEIVSEMKKGVLSTPIVLFQSSHKHHKHMVKAVEGKSGEQSKHNEQFALGNLSLFINKGNINKIDKDKLEPTPYDDQNIVPMRVKPLTSLKQNANQNTINVATDNIKALSALKLSTGNNLSNQIFTEQFKHQQADSSGDLGSGSLQEENSDTDQHKRIAEIKKLFGVPSVSNYDCENKPGSEKISTCRYCNYPIVFVVDSNGKNMPVTYNRSKNIRNNEAYDPEKHRLHKEDCRYWPSKQFKQKIVLVDNLNGRHFQK